MKKMKRNRGLSLLLAVVMTLSVLSGGLTAYAAEYEGSGTAASAQDMPAGAAEHSTEVLQPEAPASEPAAGAEGEDAPEDVSEPAEPVPEAGTVQSGSEAVGRPEEAEPPLEAKEESPETADGQETPPSASGRQTMETHTLKWLSGSSQSEIAGNQLTITPDRNGPNASSVTAQLNFSFGGEKNMPAGAITIRLPRHIFSDRRGDPVGTVTVPLAKAPAAEGVTGFHYSFDEKTDEIVLTNFTEIPASYFFNCQISYQFVPYSVQDGYTNNKIQATFEVKMPDSDESILATSEALGVQVETAVPGVRVSKSATSKYEKWQKEWGEKPADAEDYFYVVWRLYTTVEGNGTQPFQLTYREKLGSDGEIIGWSSRSGRFVAGDKEAFEQYVFHSVKETARDSSLTYLYDTVYVRYPRDVAASQNYRVQNEVTVVVTGMDGDEKTAASTATYTYTHVNFEYPGDKLAVYKNGSSTRYGGINELEAGRDIESSDAFGLVVNHRGYGLTDKGTLPYTTCLEDKQLYISNEKLTPEDYSFTKFYVYSLSQYGYRIDDELGYTTEMDTDFEHYQPVEVYVRTVENPDWTKLGSIRKSNSMNYYWNGEDGSHVIQSSSAPVTLPAGTYDISFRHTGSQYMVDFRASLYVKLHPSEHILKLAENQSEIVLYNICNAYGTDSTGAIRTGGTPPTLSTTIKEQIREADQQEYGQLIAHDYVTQSLTRWAPHSGTEKIVDSQRSDPTGGREIVSYLLRQYDYLKLSNADQKQEVLDSGVFTEHRDGVFYDLLPPGTFIDTGSVRAYMFGLSAKCAYSLSLEENWRGSGRTMAVIHVTAPQDMENIYVYNTMYSGFVVAFDLVNTWENIHDYGSNVLNSMAYYSNDGNLAEGRADDGGTISDKAWFADLDGDGNQDPDKKNVLYSSVTTTFAPLTASELGFKKAVKAPHDSSYEMRTEAVASGEYTYQLRFGNSAGIKSKNVVIYDVLESAWQNDTAHWQGTLKSIDTTQAARKGIDVKIYYSTDPSIGKITTGSPYEDLSNAEIWSLTPPADLSRVKAIAIDLSKKTDGSDYVFTPEEVGLCYVTMTAPAEVEAYLDDPETPADETVYAYNSAYLHTTSFPASGGIESTAIEECARTQVAVRESKVEIHKTSDPATGSETEPALVEVGNSILYTLDVLNRENADVIRNVAIEDEIPEGLAIDTQNIRVYFGSDASAAEPVSGSKRVQLTAEGRKLTFMVDRLDALESVHLLIPTTVTQMGAAGMTFENTAEITGFNNKKKIIESESTWHKTDPETVDVQVNKVWEDRENAYGTRPESVTVQLYADGAAVQGKTAELNAGNNWSYTFAGLVRFQKDGETEIHYSIREAAAPGSYTARYSADGKTVTNVLNSRSGNVGTDLKVLKYRSGTEIPVPGAVFRLTDEQGNVVATATTGPDGVAAFAVTPPADVTDYALTLEEESAPAGYTAATEAWQVRFTRGDSPATSWNADKQALETVWVWTSAVTQNGERCGAYENGTLTVYNEYAAAAQFAFTAAKQLTGRPLQAGEFTFAVKDEAHRQVAQGVNRADGSIEFSAIPYTLADVGTHVYTVEEVPGALPDVSYDRTVFTIPVEVTDNGDGTLTATAAYPENGMVFHNTYAPPGGGAPAPAGTAVSVQKVWEDNGSDKRPSAVEVQLYRDGAAYGGPVRLSAENGWSYTWKGLEEKAAWTVDEPSVPDGYRKSIAHTGNNWTITNRDVQQPAGQPEPPVPQTGDEANVHAWLVMMLSALLGIAFLGGLKLYSRKRGKRS